MKAGLTGRNFPYYGSKFLINLEMENIYLISITALAVMLSILAFYLVKVKHQLKDSIGKNELEKLSEQLERKDEELKTLQSKSERLETEIISFQSREKSYLSEIASVKEKYIYEKQEEYKRGLAEGKEMTNFKVVPEPFKSAIKSSILPFSQQKYEIGTKYIVHINGNPTPYSHTEIFEIVSQIDINEDKVANISSKILQSATGMPEVNLGEITNKISDFGSNLLSWRKSKQ